MKLQKSQTGFSAIHILLLLVLMGIISFTGWRVYDMNKSSKPVDSSATPTPAAKKEEAKIPEGFVAYENKELGFKFAYPKAWNSPKITEHKGTISGISYFIDFYTDLGKVTNKSIIFRLTSEDFKTESPSGAGLRITGPDATKEIVLTKINSFSKDANGPYGQLKIIKLSADSYIVASIKGLYGIPDYLQASRIVSIPKLGITAIFSQYDGAFLNPGNEKNECVVDGLSPNSQQKCITQASVDQLDKTISSFTAI